MKKLILISFILIMLTGCMTLEWGNKFLEEPNAVEIGMTAEEVISVWGKPHTINKTQSADYITIQWVYSHSSQFGYDAAYIYFENGKVATIQN